MSLHPAKIEWKRETTDFHYDTYNREHIWTMKDGRPLRASAAVAYKGKPDCVDPEEALVAAAASCHMLTFLAIAAKKKIIVDAYLDEPVGHLLEDADGKIRITRIDLKPQVVFAKTIAVTPDQLQRLHISAHQHCFIANSIQSVITVNGTSF